MEEIFSSLYIIYLYAQTLHKVYPLRVHIRYKHTHRIFMNSYIESIHSVTLTYLTEGLLITVLVTNVLV